MRDRIFTAIRLYCIIAIVNIAFFIAIWLQSGGANPNNAKLLDWGANFAPLTLSGESWRLLTSAFLHASWLHLLLNMYMLLLLGSALERMIGSWRLGSIYLLSALGASLSSAIWYGHHEIIRDGFASGSLISVNTGIHPVISVGASGALMGLAGAALFLSLKPQQNADAQVKSGSIAQVILINLVYGFFAHGVDNFAHLGGLMTGLLTAILLCRGDAPATYLRRAGLSTLVTVIGSLVFVWLAQRSGNANLVTIKDSIQADRAEIVQERQARLARQRARQAAAKEQADIDRMAQADALAQPAPSSLDAAWGKTIPVGLRARGIAIGASGRNAYITDSTGNALYVVDLTNLAVLHVIPGAPLRPSKEVYCHQNGNDPIYCDGLGAVGVATSSDERVAYVTSMALDSVTRIDLVKGQALDSVKTGRYPKNLLISPNDDMLYVINSLGGSITVVSIAQWPKIVATLNIGNKELEFEGVSDIDAWLSADGKRLFAISTSASKIYEFDTQNLQHVVEHSTRLGSDGINYIAAMPTPSMNGIWMKSRYSAPWFYPNTNALAWVDPTTLAIKKTYAICNTDVNVESVSPDGAWLAVMAYPDKEGALEIVKAATRRAIRAYPLHTGGYAMAVFGKDGKTLYALYESMQFRGDAWHGALIAYDVDKFIAPKATPPAQGFLCPALMPEKPKDAADDGAGEGVK